MGMNLIQEMSDNGQGKLKGCAGTTAVKDLFPRVG